MPELDKLGVTGSSPVPQRVGEYGRVGAAGELRADIVGVGGLFEQVGVDVEGDARARVAEDAADLDDVEADVDDQVAGVGVTEVVGEAQASLGFPLRACAVCGGAGERARRATLRRGDGRLTSCCLAKT